MVKFWTLLFCSLSKLAIAGSVKELKEHLDYLAAREMILSQNLANLDTPNYKPKDLEKNQKKQSFSMATTHPGHIGVENFDNFTLVDGEIAEIKPNGNAVTAEKELSKKNENAINFTQTSNVLAAVNRMRKLSIKGN